MQPITYFMQSQQCLRRTAASHSEAHRRQNPGSNTYICWGKHTCAPASTAANINKLKQQLNRNVCTPNHMRVGLSTWFGLNNILNKISCKTYSEPSPTHPMLLRRDVHFCHSILRHVNICPRSELWGAGLSTPGAICWRIHVWGVHTAPHSH